MSSALTPFIRSSRAQSTCAVAISYYVVIMMCVGAGEKALEDMSRRHGGLVRHASSIDMGPVSLQSCLQTLNSAHQIKQQGRLHWQSQAD